MAYCVAIVDGQETISLGRLSWIAGKACVEVGLICSG